MKIQNVLICGLGAIGTTIGAKILERKYNLKVLVDEARLKRYTENPIVFNNEQIQFEYILPPNLQQYKPDLIIIAVKFDGLESVLSMLGNYVTPNVKILSLINGISSEDIIKNKYPESHVIKSYFVGHSAVRENNNITQDGIWEIVFEKDNLISDFFEKVGIKYSNPDDIDYSMWLKFTLNIISNQVSAILNMTFGELKNNKNFRNYALNLIDEVKKIAEYKGINGLENLEADTFKFLDRMCDEGKTSMLQDILAVRKTEVDIFAGEIIRLGKLYGIQTPYNQNLYDLIKIKEEANEYRIHTC